MRLNKILASSETLIIRRARDNGEGTNIDSWKATKQDKYKTKLRNHATQHTSFTEAPIMSGSEHSCERGLRITRQYYKAITVLRRG